LCFGVEYPAGLIHSGCVMRNTTDQTTIVFIKATGQFTTVPSGDIATAMFTLGNAEGFDRGLNCSGLPRGTVAKLSGSGRLAKLEVIAPNGETLHQFGGRVHLKAEAEKLRPFVSRLLNEKRGGAIAEF
jgi:hypothetical protein